MASFWFWLISVLGSIIGGALGILILYGFFTLLRDWLFLKRGIPRKRSKVAEWIKEHPEKFDKTNPEKEDKKLNANEEVKNAGKERGKYREFEKLRRAELKGRTRQERTSDRSSKGTPQLQRGELLQNEPSPIDTDVKPRSSSAKPRVKLDD